MDKLPISELIEKLGKAKDAANAVYVDYKKLKTAEEDLKAQLFSQLSETGLKSAKGELYAVSIASKPTVVIQHEQSVIEWLQETPDVETDQYIGLKKREFESLAKAMLKNTGEMIPGTAIEVRESLSVKANKK